MHRGRNRHGEARLPHLAASHVNKPSGPTSRAARAHSVTHHGVTIEDPYAWLRDPAYPEVNDPDVLGYLKAENTYFEAAMKPHRGLIDTLFAEMKGRVKDDDASVPQKDGAFVYWNAFDPGGEYRKWYRRPARGGPRPSSSTNRHSRKVTSISGSAATPSARMAACSPMPSIPTVPNASF